MHVLKEFKQRLNSLGLSKESEKIIVRRRLVDRVDMTYALAEAVEIGKEQVKLELQGGSK